MSWNGCTDNYRTISNNGLYPKALENFMSGNLDFFDILDSGNLVIALVDQSSSDSGNGYQPCANDQYYSSAINPNDVAAITNFSSPDVQITGTFAKDVWDGIGMFLSSSATVFPLVNASVNGGNIGNIVVFVDGAVPGTDDYLIGSFQYDFAYQPIDIEPDGDNITVNWDFDNNYFTGCVFKLISAP